MTPAPRRLLSSLLLLATVAGLGAWLATWKGHALRQAEAASLAPAEPAETVAVATVREAVSRPTTTAIGTVSPSAPSPPQRAGRHRADVRLAPGRIVEAGELLLALDVEVERAELAALEARAALAETTLARLERLIGEQATSETAVDQARAARDVARADIARTRAIIDRKTIRAPFRARVGLARPPPGQHLAAGPAVPALQAVAGPVHVDFAVPQSVAAGLRRGVAVTVAAADLPPRPAAVVAVDARVNPETRNATVRARLEGAPADLPSPGASVQVTVPVGPPQPALVIPAVALRKGPDGDHVFVVASGDDRQPRAHLRRVESSGLDGAEAWISQGLAPGAQVATSVSFTPRDGLLVTVPDGPRASSR